MAGRSEPRISYTDLHLDPYAPAEMAGRAQAVGVAKARLDAAATAYLVYRTGQWTLAGGKVGASALTIANAKVNLSFGDALARGILCNALVTLAVWLCFSARSNADKILAIVPPIAAFVAA